MYAMRHVRGSIHCTMAFVQPKIKKNVMQAGKAQCLKKKRTEGAACNFCSECQKGCCLKKKRTIITTCH